MIEIEHGRRNLYQWDINQRVIVGVPAGTEIHFYHSEWSGDDGLTLHAYEDAGAVYADIPNLFLTKAGKLRVYIFITDGDSGYTVEKREFIIEAKAKPSGYVYTETEVLTWKTLDARLIALEDEGIANAVAAYLQENPVEAGATEEEAAQIQQNKEAIDKLTTDKLDATALPDAVNAALTMAKESGEFKGEPGEPGEPGKDYVLTDADKSEIAEMTAELVDVPESGGNAGYAGVEPAHDDIPKVFIKGVKPTTKDDVLAEMQYISKTDKFHAYLEIKCQGTSSMSHPKKNFTVKMYSDEARKTKLKKSFKDWNHNGNKYVLKANYIDHAHARNIVSARLWGEVVASRKDYASLPAEMRNSPNNGAVDGFPIKVYYNDTYEGIYTWNIGKDDWMWGMDDDNPNHILLCAEGNTDGVYAETSSNFRALWNGVDGAKPGWSVEVGTNSEALKNSLNALIQFVMDNNGDAFRNGIGNYLDIQSAIDYYIFQYEICGLDGLAHNLLLATYDGKIWRCGAYDLDSTFGLWWNGGYFVPATYRCPEDYQEQFNLLWERIEANFQPELTARQVELRKTVLSYPNMVSHFERFMDTIGAELYAEDLTVYTNIPSGSTNNIKQIRNFIRDRQAYVDAEFAEMKPPVPCTGITLNKSVLNFTSEGTQIIAASVSPAGCTDIIRWESSNPRIASVNDGVVTAVANGAAVITANCGDYSASCSVLVSGLVYIVPCTGITLDATELEFDASETKIITATVTPSNTNDSMIWVSDNPAVASISVDGNVCTVQSVANGFANITVTCGDYSASCYVNVTGFVEGVKEASGVFKGVSLNEKGYVNESGVVTTGSQLKDMYSDHFDISSLSGKKTFVSASAGSRVVCYDNTKTFISVLNEFGTVADSAKYGRLSLADSGQSIVLSVFDETNYFSAEDVTIGSYGNDNIFNPNDTGSCTFEIDIPADAKAVSVQTAWKFAFLNSAGEFISSTNAISNRAIPEGAAKVAVCTWVQRKEEATLQFYKKHSSIVRE